MGRLAVKSWSLGEVALLFSMTRPTLAAETVPFEGHTPLIVWVLLVGYTGAGLFSSGLRFGVLVACSDGILRNKRLREGPGA